MIEVLSKTLDNGYKVVVSYDPEPSSPREWCNVGTVLINKDCRYSFGDEAVSVERIQEVLEDKNLISLPIYLYDHSGITINTTGFSCHWDSGKVGVIYCTKEDAVKEFGKKILTAKVREKTLNCLQGEIKDLDQYIRGEVYALHVYTPTEEEVYSCYGYYGEPEFVLSEGISYVEV